MLRFWSFTNHIRICLFGIDLIPLQNTFCVYLIHHCYAILFKLRLGQKSWIQFPDPDKYSFIVRMPSPLESKPSKSFLVGQWMDSMPQKIFSQRSTSDQDKPVFPSNSHFSKAFKPIFTYSSDVLCKQSEILFLREINSLLQNEISIQGQRICEAKFFREINYLVTSLA